MDSWQRVLDLVEKRVDSQHYNSWFRPTRFIKAENRSLFIRVPDPSFQERLYKDIDIVLKAAKDAGVGDIDVIYLSEGPIRETEINKTDTGRPESESTASTLNPKYTFDTFVVGSSNKFAFSAALAVARTPSKSYNPLFLYGRGGLGKTHLLHAIGQEIAFGNRLRLICVSGEMFSNELNRAIRHDRILEFRERYCNCDVLLIDDVQFITSNARMQEEFLYTFNWLYGKNKQIIISAHGLPREISGLDDRLHSRLEWGLTADIQPPDLETRVAIIKKKASVHNVVLPNKVALYIAANIRLNVRELEGALVRLTAYCSLTASEITLSTAHEALRDFLNANEKRISIDMIQRRTAEYFEVRLQDLKAKNQLKPVTLPRQVSMYLCRQLTRASLPQIAREFGGRHHTTVLNSVEKIERLRLIDRKLNEAIEALSKSLDANVN